MRVDAREQRAELFLRSEFEARTGVGEGGGEELCCDPGSELRL